MRTRFALATTLAALALTSCASYGVEDWGDRLTDDQAAVKVAPGQAKLVHTPPGTSRQVWSVLLLLDAPQGAHVVYGQTGETSELIQTGRSPNYVRVRAPGGSGIHVENPGDGEISATLLVQWREFVD